MKNFLFGFTLGAIIAGATGAIVHLNSQPLRYSEQEITACRRILQERAFAPEAVRQQLWDDEMKTPAEHLKWEIIRAIARVDLY